MVFICVSYVYAALMGVFFLRTPRPPHPHKKKKKSGVIAICSVLERIGKLSNKEIDFTVNVQPHESWSD